MAWGTSREAAGTAARCKQPVFAGSEHPDEALVCTRCLSELVEPGDAWHAARLASTGQPHALHGVLLRHPTTVDHTSASNLMAVSSG